MKISPQSSMDPVTPLSHDKQSARLGASFQRLDATAIKQHLNAKLDNITVFETLHSTNDYLRDTSKNNLQLEACLAETQTHGKGQLDRSWHSPFGQNIYFSLRYPFKKNTKALSGLSLVTSLATCAAIEQTCSLPKPLTIKWPNDVFYEDRKLAGSLIEMQSLSKETCAAIIGIGINVNLDKDDEQKITQPWTSLFQITQTQQNRNRLCAALIDQLFIYLKLFEQHGLPHFMNEWNTRDALLHRNVQLTSGTKQYTGEYLGINAQGQLQLKLFNHSIQSFSSACVKPA